jgi:hypothetical protein
MVIHNLHIAGVVVFPPETDPPLIIDADTVLALPVAGKRLEPVPGRDPEIRQRHRRIQQVESPLCLSPNTRWEFPGSFPSEQFFRIPAPEGFDHGRILTLCVINVKRYQPKHAGHNREIGACRPVHASRSGQIRS